MAVGREIKETVGFTTTTEVKISPCRNHHRLTVALPFFRLTPFHRLLLLLSEPSSYERDKGDYPPHIFESGNIMIVPHDKMQHEEYYIPSAARRMHLQVKLCLFPQLYEIYNLLFQASKGYCLFILRSFIII